MNCREAHEAILEADLAALESPGSTPLGRHLQACPDCRARARAILKGEAHIAVALARGLAPPNLDEVLERGTGTETGPATAPRQARRGISPGRVIRTLIPLTAAAILVVFLGRAPSLPGPIYLPPPEDPGLNVEVPQGQSVAVMETTNPAIAVVWIF